MVKDSRIDKTLRHFRAGVEGIISFLKRGFGLDRCRRKGLRSFKVYAISSVVSTNLLTLALKSYNRKRPRPPRRDARLV